MRASKMILAAVVLSELAVVVYLAINIDLRISFHGYAPSITLQKYVDAFKLPEKNEIVLRPNFTVYNISDEIPIRAKPNYSQIVNFGNVIIPPFVVTMNSEGLRDYEHTYEKPSGTYRIVFLGDSTTFGWGVNVSDSVPKQLESMLNGSSGRRVEVINFGLPGDNTLVEYYRLNETGVLYSPDMVIIGYHHTDMENQTFRVECFDNNKNFPSGDDDATQLKMTQLSLACELKDYANINSDFDYAWKTRVEYPLDGIENLSKTYGFRIAVAEMPVDVRIPNEQRMKLKPAIERRGWTFINNSEYFSSVTNGFSDVSAITVAGRNDSHANALGNRMIAGLIAARIEPMIS